MQYASVWEFFITAIKAAPTELTFVLVLAAVVVLLPVWWFRGGFDFRASFRPFVGNRNILRRGKGKADS
jgi:hypothetical protein